MPHAFVAPVETHASAPCAPKSAGTDICILYLFSGKDIPIDQGRSFEYWAQQIGKSISVKVTVVSFDVLNGSRGDLADDSIWQVLLVKIRGRTFHALLCSPPCGTYGCRRLDGGPPPLRAAHGPELYGFRHLRPEDKARVRLANLLAIRAAEACREFHAITAPFIGEQPKRRQGRPHMFVMEEWKQVEDLTGVSSKVTAQCQFADFESEAHEKLTELLHYMVDLSDAKENCSHESQWWRDVPSGKWLWLPHAPLKGKVSAVPADKWSSTPSNRQQDRELPWLTAAAATYSSRLNKWLAMKLIHGVVNHRHQDMRSQTGAVVSQDSVPLPRTACPRGLCGETPSQVPWNKFYAGTPQVRFSTPLTGKPPVITPQRVIDNADAIGGLRYPQEACERFKGLGTVGIAVRKLMIGVVDEDIYARCLAAIGSSDKEAGPTEEQIKRGQRALRDFFKIPALSVDGLQQADIPTPLQHDILEAWSTAARDPEVHVCSWLKEGAPAGLRMPIPTCGIFPQQSLDHESIDNLELHSEDSDFVNYSGIEDDEAAAELVFGLRDRGKVREFQKWQQVIDFVEDTAVLSKIGIIRKVVNGVTKLRVIVDSKQSGVSKATDKSERTVLPRITDVVQDSLWHLSHHSDEERTEYFILDFSDAFFIVPLHPRERRHFVVKFRGKYYVFLVLPQGASASPLSWGRVAALAGRLTQGMFAPTELLLRTFVDDPCATISGEPDFRESCMVLIIFVWRCLGFPLSFKKGQRGRSVTWIGCSLTLSLSSVAAAQVASVSSIT